MNIFIIPSWYPSPRNPIAGIFFHEQAKALGKNSDHKFIISVWGQGKFSLPIKKPILAISNFFSFLKTWPYFHKISKNTFEALEPALNWNLNIFFGNMANIFKANEKNFEKAQEKFGKIDLIHAYVSFPAGYVAMELARKYKIPYIISEVMGLAHFPEFLKDGTLSPLVKEPLDKANRVLAISPSLKQDLEKLGVKKVIAMPFMVNENYFKPARKFSQKISFFTLATICHDKGIGDLLVAIEAVIKQKPEVRFRIGGKGPDLDFYKNQARLLGIDKNVKWLGQLSRGQARDEFQQCHSFILPSHLDTFGVVYAEAIACGKPVIATRCGGPESIVNRQNGILVKVCNPEQLSRAILNMSDNFQKYPVKQIRQDFLRRFSTKIITKQVINIYKMITQTGSKNF